MLNGLLITVSGMEDTESTGIKKFLDAVNEGIIGSVAEFMYENYKNAFNYSGHVSLEVKEKLYQQLLLGLDIDLC